MQALWAFVRLGLDRVLVAWDVHILSITIGEVLQHLHVEEINGASYLPLIFNQLFP